MFDGDVFKSLNQLRKERVGDLGNDEAKDPAATRNQRAILRKVVKLVDYLPHTLPF